MPEIRVLPEDVASRIAAGEVVERPASVVKELVENSLDAGAGVIDVAIEAGGRASIRVTDDGHGMDGRNLALCARRHATSKLRTFDDLDTLATMGFRGEALPSIASVSLLTLTTCPAGSGTGDSPDPTGRRLEMRGGGEGSMTEVPAASGTTVEVKSLFFNTPARRKFLRSIPRETSVVASVVSALALAHPGCGFRLTADGRRLIDVPPGDERAGRVAALMPRGDALIPVMTVRDGMEIEAWVSGVADSRTDRTAQRFFVNGRSVRDKALSHAVSQAYGPVLPPGRHPIVVLFLNVPASEVDVNVHPTKSEVRFRRGGAVHAAVASALRQALRTAGALPALETARLPSRALEGPAVGENAAGPLTTGGPEPAALFGGSPGGGGTLSERAAPFAGGDPEAGRGLSGAEAIAQYRSSYVIAADDEGLVLIDQHAAHERVLFERLLEAGASGGAEVQPLLVPATITLAAELAAGLEASCETLAEIGFEVEPFGPEGAIVRAVPAELSGCDAGRLLEDVLADLSRESDAPGTGHAVEDVQDRFPGAGALDRRRRAAAASAGCHAAIKVNMPLAREKMSWLLDALARCRVPTTCPHGRPTTLRLTHAEIERAFRRR